MASVTLLPSILTITFVQLTFFLIHLQPDWQTDTSMPRRTLKQDPQYARAVQRCRKAHKFFFLDLPVAVRGRIYSYLFNDPVFLVCSFAKDRSLRARDDWPDTARAQILCTCSTVRKEATKLLYWHTNWQFPTESSLSYFTWHDVASSKLSHVAKITLTNDDAIQEFAKIAPRLNGLRMLVVDIPFRFERFAPLPVSQHASFARRGKKTPLYKDKIAAHSIDNIPPRCCLFVVVEVACKMQNGRST